MNRSALKYRLGLSLYLTAILAASFPQTAIAATMDANFELYPHCDKRTSDEDDDVWMLGPIPSPGIVVETGGGRGGITCTEFEVHDPQTLKTRPLREGDILDIDIVIDNPTEQDISRARAWLSYDPDVLRGDSVEIHSDFPVVTPGENTFSADEGYVKIGASTDGSEPDQKKVMFARIQFTVLDDSVGRTPITFHDPQLDGHTVIMAQDGSEEAYVLEDDPGVLLVVFGEGDEPMDEQEENIEEDMDDEEVDTDDLSPFENLPVPDNSCVSNNECSSGICIDGFCAEEGTKVPNGGSCITDNQCESGLCGSGICIPSLSDEESDEPIEEISEPSTEDDNPPSSRTAFSLLQIQNVRVTTDGSAAFLSWNPLNSTQLKAYNVYYGTTSGRYIQRKTIDKSENTITIRSLSVGTTYYFAVRALSTGNEESAFSKEVSITIGNPNSSTAPLLLGSVVNDDISPVNPIGDGATTTVPGETGIPTLILLGALGAAIVGTGFASRRQLAVSTFNPHD